MPTHHIPVQVSIRCRRIDGIEIQPLIEEFVNKMIAAGRRVGDQLIVKDLLWKVIQNSRDQVLDQVGLAKVRQSACECVIGELG